MVSGAVGIDLAFFLDGQSAGRYSIPVTRDFKYSYNQLYFKAEGLQNIPHTWILQNGNVKNIMSNVLLDYLVYTKCPCRSLSKRTHNECITGTKMLKQALRLLSGVRPRHLVRLNSQRLPLPG